MFRCIFGYTTTRRQMEQLGTPTLGHESQLPGEELLPAIIRLPLSLLCDSPSTFPLRQGQGGGSPTRLGLRCAIPG